MGERVTGLDHFGLVRRDAQDGQQFLARRCARFDQRTLILRNLLREAMLGQLHGLRPRFDRRARHEGVGLGVAVPPSPGPEPE